MIEVGKPEDYQAQIELIKIRNGFAKTEEVYMKRILSVSNRKGGSGKTTTTVNIAAALAHQGKEVLVVDADPQAHTSLSLGIKPKDVSLDLYSLLVDKREPEEVMADTYLKQLKVIPASRRLTIYERTFSATKEARHSLCERLQDLNGRFDYVIFDTPPTLSLLTISALIASEEVYVPMQAHFLSLEGLVEMVTLISKINKLYNPKLKLRGIIPTFYKERTRLSQAIIAEIKKNLGEGIILHPVRVNVALAEAPSFGKTIFQYRLKSHGAFDYLSIAKQIEGLS